MSQIVRFHRPEAPKSVCSMFVADEDSAPTHIRHMQSLGYTVVNDSPPPAGRPPMRSEFLARPEQPKGPL